MERVSHGPLPAEWVKIGVQITRTFQQFVVSSMFLMMLSWYLIKISPFTDQSCLVK